MGDRKSKAKGPEEKLRRGPVGNFKCRKCGTPLDSPFDECPYCGPLDYTVEGKIEITIQARRAFAIVGLVMMSASLFLPWIGFESRFGLELSYVEATGLDLSVEVSVGAILFLVIGSVIVLFYKKIRNSGIICLAMGSWMAIVALAAYIDLQSRLESLANQGFLHVTILSGFYLLVTGVVMTLAGGILLATTKQKNNQTEVLDSPETL